MAEQKAPKFQEEYSAKLPALAFFPDTPKELLEEIEGNS